VTAPNTLGEYLRARRELVDPSDVGLRVAGVRRTPGLRREEVATLAGISADYYLRLEQGRDRNPSPQVLTALARVLGLDATAASYLLSVAASGPARSRTRAVSQETVPAGIRQLISAINLPAFVESRMFDVLTANPRATSLSPSMRAGENRLRSMFLDPAERDLYPDWRKAIGGMIASFRASIGQDADDPRIAQLVGELSLASEPFRKLWARHDVRALSGGAVTMNHPEAGPLALWREKLPVGDSGGQVLVVYHAEPGSDSARALERLAPAATAIADTAMADTESADAGSAAPPALTGPASAFGATGARSQERQRRG
jgi:transcriptional regulator with XRE-family HTH domain